LGIDSTNIFINLKGRFPQGIVQHGSEYENLRVEIIQGLMDFADPVTGEGIVERVYRREELYQGPCLGKAPDLLVTWKDFEYNTRRGYGREGVGFLGSSLEFSDVTAYSSLQKSGTHHPTGIFIGSGSPFKKMTVEGARIIDLAPTILYLLGVEVPGDMDGRVLAEIIEDDFQSRHPVRFKSRAPVGERVGPFEYTEREEKDVRDRLQGLGYVE
jgi:predicted AlkP superfamily phosphohydrolase/phosphomutase